MTSRFIPYQPAYSSTDWLRRCGVILRASAGVAWQLMRQTQTAFAASVEVTDRCNAGCSYCYVYNPQWNQHQRLQGYLQLTRQEHHQQEKQVFETLEQLKKQGIIHVTLVGGETSLAPKAIWRAAELFPVVWVVTNGTRPLPRLPHSAITFVSLDGPPDYHNRSRDPQGFFAKHRHGNLRGMSAAIVRNINESERGAYVHITLTPPALPLFPEAVGWLVRDVKKLRGIVVSGAATQERGDPMTFRAQDRQELKREIAAQAQKYGWKLFPFNQPIVNQFLFDEQYIIHDSSRCSVAKRVKSLDFAGKSVGKCVLREATLCETCVCNITGLARAIDTVHVPTIFGVLQASFG